MRFTKMQALGNDFVALNGYALPEMYWSALAPPMCDRHFGIGADGLFVALPSEIADTRMLFFNPDGSEDRCGNGLRCFAYFLHQEGILRRDRFSVETFGGPVDLAAREEHGCITSVTVELGRPVLDAPEIPLALPPGPALDVPLLIDGREWRLNAVSTGTPHAVILVDELPDEETFQSVSPRIETNPLFPERTSVIWTKFDTPSHATTRIWERAAGETLGCGTGAAAVAVVGRLRGVGSEGVMVASRGGEVLCAWDGEDSLTLTGPAQTVYQGEWLGAPETPR